MSENTLSEQIEIIIHDVLDQQPTLKSCKIIKNYSTGNFVDIRLSSDEILKYIQCIGDNTVGSEAVLCFMENNFKNPVVISDSSNALCELRDLIDNIEVGEVDLSDYVSETVLNSILSSYVTSDYANMNYALKSDLFSGNYEDLTNKPHIPSKTSDLINDTGFLTNHQSLSDYLTWEEFNSLISSYALSSALNNYYTKLESDEKYSQIGHNHDDRYYTEDEMDTLLSNKSNKIHTHSPAQITGNIKNTIETKNGTHILDYSPMNLEEILSYIINNFEDVSWNNHNHDERYYTETEINTLLSSYAVASNYYTKSEVLEQISSFGGEIPVFQAESLPKPSAYYLQKICIIQDEAGNTGGELYFCEYALKGG